MKDWWKHCCAVAGQELQRAPTKASDITLTTFVGTQCLSAGQPYCPAKYLLKAGTACAASLSCRAPESLAKMKTFTLDCQRTETIGQHLCMASF
mmetsp:Transcript_33162/g.59528  ORF Transcript_33162/g.59528 Transcript_33162/m.59528 type:complete len:94 (-) Transcript_33162:112-393(-)